MCTKRVEQFAKRYHHGQTRQNGKPFIEHPQRVSKMLQSLGCNSEIVDAAMLHDIYEEANISHRIIFSQFGTYIGSLVYFLSKERKSIFAGYDNPRKVRLYRYMRGLLEASRNLPELLLIKMADQLDNVQTIDVFEIAKQDELIDEIESLYLPLYEGFRSAIPKQHNAAFKTLYKELRGLVKKESKRIKEALRKSRRAGKINTRART